MKVLIRIILPMIQQQQENIMEKTPTLTKHSAAKKLDHLIKQQQYLQLDKQYSPGKVDFHNTPQCQATLLNFFGDVHTEVFSLKVSSDEKNVIAACSNGEAKLYDLIEGKVLSIHNTSRMVGYSCTSAKWKPVHTDDYVACNCDGSIRWYNSHQDHAYGHYENHQKAYLCCDYQSLQEWCALGTDINTIDIFDNQTLKPIRQYEAGGPSQLNSNHHTNRVFSVKCLPKDANIFFTGGWDSTVHVWDIRVNSGSVRKINGPVVSADSLDIKNNVLLAGNYLNNDIAQLYDFGSGQLIKTLDIGEEQNSKSYCFAASYAHHSEHNLIAVGLTGSNSVKVLLNEQLVCTMKFQAAPLCLDFYRFNDKDFLVVGGLQGTIYTIKMKIHK